MNIHESAKHLARLMINTKNIHEDSWNSSINAYEISIEAAAKQVCTDDNAAYLYLVISALTSNWNQTIYWADKVINS